MRKFLFLSLVILFLFTPLFTLQAQISNLDATYRFLNIPTSPRTAALGGNHVSLPNSDVSLFLLNPAYLSGNHHGQLALSYLNHLADVNMGFASGAFHHDELGTFGIGFRFVGYGEMIQTNAIGEELGTFTANDFAMNLGYARQIQDQLTAGVAFQFIHSSYHTFRSTGLAISAGLHYTFDDEQTWAGVSFGNLGRQVNYFDEQREDLPFDLRTSITRQLTYLPLRLSATAHSLTQWEMPSFNDEQTPRFADHLFRHLIIGGEFLFSENFHVRLGYNHFLHEELRSDARIDLGGASIGVGIQLRGFQFDISRNSYSDIGRLTQLGIQYQL